MSVALELVALMAYSDQERKKWRTWIEADPSRLSIPFQRGGRFPTVGNLLDHMFLVERRHLTRMQGGAVPDNSHAGLATPGSRRYCPPFVLGSGHEETRRHRGRSAALVP